VSSPLVSLAGIERRYPRAEREVRALAGVDLEIARGELIALTGPSGSGKSTLLHVIGLLETPNAGTYRFDGEDVSHLDDDARSLRRGRDIGFVFQAFHLISHRTIRENVELPLAYGGIDEPARRTRALRALATVGLESRTDHRPGELSGGEQQRAAIARALVGEPRLLLADEPTGNLDERTADGILELFRAVHADGTTVVLVTHDERVAAIAGRRLALAEGRFVESGPPSPALRETSRQRGEVSGGTTSPFGERSEAKPPGEGEGS